MDKYLVIDIGGTFIKCALMDADANFLEKITIDTPQDSRESLVKAIGELSDNYSDAKMITISMPGIIDTTNNHVLAGGALGYNKDFYFGKALEERCNKKVVINNDAKCAASAEASIGALKDVKDGLVIIFGTMIGGGIVLNHEVRNGSHFSSGELSYILCAEKEDPTFDNVFGNVNSTTGLCRRYAKLKNLPLEEVNGIKVFDSYKSGDQETKQLLDDFTKEIAVKIFTLQTIIDLDKVAIGGGISAEPLFIEMIQKQLHRLHEVSMYYVPEVKIDVCKFKNDANLIGALQFALKQKA